MGRATHQEICAYTNPLTPWAHKDRLFHGPSRGIHSFHTNPLAARICWEFQASIVNRCRDKATGPKCYAKVGDKESERSNRRSAASVVFSVGGNKAMAIS